MAITMIETTDARPGDEVEFLDLDGDGVLDAVRTRNVTLLHLLGQDAIHVREELDAGIDDDGVPHSVQLSETLVESAR